MYTQRRTVGVCSHFFEGKREILIGDCLHSEIQTHKTSSPPTVPMPLENFSRVVFVFVVVFFIKYRLPMVIDSTLLLVLLRNEKNGYEQRVDVVTAGGIHLSTSNKTSKSSQKEKENRRCRNATDFSTAFFSLSFTLFINIYLT